MGIVTKYLDCSYKLNWFFKEMVSSSPVLYYPRLVSYATKTKSDFPVVERVLSPIRELLITNKYICHYYF